MITLLWIAFVIASLIILFRFVCWILAQIVFYSDRKIYSGIRKANWEYVRRSLMETNHSEDFKREIPDKIVVKLDQFLNTPDAKTIYVNQGYNELTTALANIVRFEAAQEVIPKILELFKTTPNEPNTN